MTTAATMNRTVRCVGFVYFGRVNKDPCGWSGCADEAIYILDERRCPTCQGELRREPARSSFPGA